MSETGWPIYQCPDCEGALAWRAGQLHCGGCGRRFERRDGIVQLLPRAIAHESIKRREKQGWASQGAATLDEAREFYLAMPYVTEPNDPKHFAEAARQMEFALAYLAPLQARQGLDLGGSIGWAAWHFARAGARMVLADFNDDPITGLGGARVYVDQGPAFERVCVDAETLPFASGQFDFIFSSAFLHHLTRPDAALRHVGRLLKPGGVYLACIEAFWPWWMSRERALRRSPGAASNLARGIHEQVFRPSVYRRWFRDGGLRLSVVNPRWDRAAPGRIEFGLRVREAHYEPELLTNRRTGGGLAGWAARRALAWGLWRPLTHPAVFAALRGPLVHSTQKYRILMGIKPGER
jgi:SAM-dependent methyltransferase